MSEQMRTEVLAMYLSIEALSERYATSLQALSEIAEAYYFRGRLDDAFRLWQTGEQFLTAPEVRPVDQMKFLLRYGGFLVQYYFLTNDEESLMLSVVQRARQGAETLQDERGIATALFLLGQTLYYHHLLTGGNDYTEARDYFLRSSALREKIGDTYELAESLFYTGLTYDRQEPLPQAKEYYLHALEIAEQWGNTWAASEATRHMTDHSDGEERLRYALRSLELRAEMNFRRALPSAQLLLSDIYVERGEMERALEYCQLAEELATEMGLQNYLVFVSLTRGDIASRQGRLTEARERFEKALELAKQLNNAFAIAAANEKLKLLDSAG
jgi:tetratricopeptide (TPR) repeat protein